MKKKLPKLKIAVDMTDEVSGVSNIAFVKSPAVLLKGFAFNSDVKPLSFADDLKYRIVSAAMVPMDIYRLDEDGTEYEVTFTEDMIDKIHQKFMGELSGKDFFNLEHSEEKVPASILEIWVVDNPLLDKAYSTYGLEVPKGTLMVTSQIHDKEYYHQLVENEQTGFSIEGLFELELSEIIKTNKQEQMKKQEFKLADGSTLIIDENGVTTIIALELEDLPVKEDEVIDDIKEDAKEEEEEMTEVAAEDMPMDEPAASGDYYSKAEIDDKFDELYRVIGELKGAEYNKKEEEYNEPVALSINQRFAEFLRFAGPSNE